VKAHTATLAGGSSNADRVFVTDHAVILLDGASAFAPVDIDPGEYAAILGEAIADHLDTNPRRDLRAVVADAIARTSAALQLDKGPSPSSTVAILRKQPEIADLYVLGDSPIHYGLDSVAEVLSDDRLSALGQLQHEEYRRRLAAGAGYTDEHRALLVELQRRQRKHRNMPGGYWIAEKAPYAANHAMMARIPADRIAWAVLSSDGAADFVDYHGQPRWHEIAHQNSDQLFALLERAHEWEAVTDPDGKLMPRAKRHDDKTVAAIPTLW
jgi:hypothetical protein